MSKRWQHKVSEYETEEQKIKQQIEAQEIEEESLLEKLVINEKHVLASVMATAVVQARFAALQEAKQKERETAKEVENELVEITRKLQSEDFEPSAGLYEIRCQAREAIAAIDHTIWKRMLYERALKLADEVERKRKESV
jgi:hypothetical protein